MSIQREMIERELEQRETELEDMQHGEAVVYSDDHERRLMIEIERLERMLAKLPKEEVDKLREFESKKKVGKVTSVGKCSITIDEYHTVSRTHLPWGSTELEIGDKVVYWTDEYGTDYAEYYLNYEPEDGEQHPYDAELREKLGNEVVDKVINSMPDFKEQVNRIGQENVEKTLNSTAPEGTGPQLKDALRDQRGKIDSEMMVYGWCILLFLGILISGLMGKYDDHTPEEQEKQRLELKGQGHYVNYVRKQ